MSEPVILPAKYYLTYFDYLIEFVQKRYSDLLTTNEASFLSAYQHLPDDARCLFIRMSNRKGNYFKTDLFSYSEIEDISQSLHLLTETGFAQLLTPTSTCDPSELLSIFTKAELIKATDLLNPVLPPLKSIKKQDLIRWLIHEHRTEQLIEAITQITQVTEVLFVEEVGLMKFLFFGNRQDDMTEFVVRDLGHVRFQSFDEESLSLQFHSRKELDDALMVSKLREAFSELTTSQAPEEVFEWFTERYHRIAEGLSPSVKPSLDRLVVKVAGWMERQKLPSQALTLYHLTLLPPARERKIRLLHKSGDTQVAIQLCLELIDSPQNADELYFGKDFLDKLSKSRKKIVRQTTQALQEAETLELPVTHRHHVELGVAHYFIKLGYNAFFSENVPWRALFGLLFWDIIYDTNVQTIHHPLQKVPSDFFQPQFYEKRESMLRERMMELTTKERIQERLQAEFEDKYGTANVLVGWYEELLDQLITISDLVRPDQLHRILMEMATDLKDKTRGFPDLLIWNREGYEFIEVKSPNDHLSARQLYWQHFFQTIGVSSKIVRVRWIE